MSGIPPIHFISHEQTGSTHIQAIQRALDAGCTCIQLRVKNKPEEEVYKLAYTARTLSNQYNSLLIINDYPQIARDVKADGVHLGLTDMPVAQARSITGNNLLLGGTANTWQQVQQRIQEKVDYIGLGPFRFTTTKQELSPVLGISGYQLIFQQAAALNITIPPVIAIGGITLDDVTELQQTGISGVALSGAITRDKAPAALVTQLYAAFTIK